MGIWACSSVQSQALGLNPETTALEFRRRSLNKRSETKDATVFAVESEKLLQQNLDTLNKDMLAEVRREKKKFDSKATTAKSKASRAPRQHAVFDGKNSRADEAETVAADSAETAADSVETAAYDAETAADSVETADDSAETAADSAETAADSRSEETATTAGIIEDNDSGTGTGTSDDVGENPVEAAVIILENGSSALASEAVEDTITAVIEASSPYAEVGRKRKGGKSKAPPMEKWQGKMGMQSATKSAKVLDSGEGVRSMSIADDIQAGCFKIPLLKMQPIRIFFLLH
jgi:uncharacterized phage infection (PIP) family protein YhgE